ncbi:DUF4476 domain-containing protein [Ilyomonas limi]|nr:DUF4476 domain-containing protein [Ilyomonas limi]
MALSLATYAQQLHFIYIQADNKQPFSVALNGKYYSSSSIGYIILPKLTDGTYTLAINFAKDSYPEQAFTVNVAGKDYGYALKNFGDKGWGLFNFQTTDVVMNSTAAPQENNQTNVTTNNSAFGNMLADVVNDKSINNLSTADTVTATNKNSRPPANDNQAAAATTDLPDTVVAAKDTITNTITRNDDAAQEATDTLNEKVRADTLAADNDTTAFTTTGVIKAEEKVGEKGTDLTFIDFNGTHNDTIKAFIPAIPKKQPAKTETQNVNVKAAEADSAKGKVNNPFFAQKNNVDTNAAATSVKPNLMEDQNAASTAPTTAAMVNTACNNMVSDRDLDKLKKRIVSQSDQDDILQTVKKNLRNKCITTAQVKDLGNLFLNDDNRYGFYDAVYPFVYDYGSYPTLESTLIDPYYKTRFKALLR